MNRIDVCKSCSELTLISGFHFCTIQRTALLETAWVNPAAVCPLGKWGAYNNPPEVKPELEARPCITCNDYATGRWKKKPFEVNQ